MKSVNNYWDYSEYFDEESPLANCLEPLLNQLGWHGSRRTIIESLPHFHKRLDITNFIKILNGFNYKNTKPFKTNSNINENLLPCLLIDKKDHFIVVKKTDSGYIAYDAQKKIYTKLAKPSGIAISFTKEETVDSGFSIRRKLWDKRWKNLLIVAFILNLISISTPLFVMTVYDKVVISESIDLLLKLLVGMSLFITVTLLLSAYKNRTLANIEQKINYDISALLFKKVISLDSKNIESASLGKQIAKLKEFDSLREFITGPLSNIIIDLPFTLLFLFAIYLLAGKIVLIPVIAIISMLLLGYLSHKKIVKMVKETSISATKRQDFLIETLNNLEQILYSGSEITWINRYKKLSSTIAVHNYRASMKTSLLNTLSEVIMMSAAISTISVGVIMNINHEISIGALIAVMMLIWKVLVPARTIQVNLPRYIQVISSFKKLKSLLAMPSESNRSKHRIFSTKIEGKIEFSHTNLQYYSYLEPALRNINFTINPGELVMIGGHNGSGKSSILKLIKKLYLPSSGNIYLDNKNIKQINTNELRQLIGYLPQKNRFFYGTIKQNLKLANPLATEKDIICALKWSNVYEEIQKLPSGIETRLRDDYKQVYSASFLQRLAIARTLVKKPRILLLDEPTEHLDEQSEKIFMNSILKLRNRYTVLMITHRPSYFKLADKVMMLNKGCLEQKSLVNILRAVK